MPLSKILKEFDEVPYWKTSEQKSFITSAIKEALTEVALKKKVEYMPYHAGYNKAIMEMDENMINFLNN